MKSNCGAMLRTSPHGAERMLMKRANIVKEAKVIHVVASALLLLSGVLFIAWADVNDTVVRCLLGCNLIVTGVARGLGYFANDLYRLAFQYVLAMGGFCVILGVLFLISPGQALVAIPYVIGAFVLLDGLLKLQTAFDAKAFGMKQWVGLLLSASAVGAFAIWVMIGSTVIVRPLLLVGIALVLDGAENIWNTMGTVRVRSKKQDPFEEMVVDFEQNKGEK